MLEGKQDLTFDLNKGPNRKQVMGQYARCQFLPANCMQTFEEMFVVGFFETGIAKFSPNVSNPTLKYVAHEDATYFFTFLDLSKHQRYIGTRSSREVFRK